jgi:hypothetical protein
MGDDGRSINCKPLTILCRAKNLERKAKCIFLTKRNIFTVDLLIYFKRKKKMYNKINIGEPKTMIVIYIHKLTF